MDATDNREKPGDPVPGPPDDTSPDMTGAEPDDRPESEGPFPSREPEKAEEPSERTAAPKPAEDPESAKPGEPPPAAPPEIAVAEALPYAEPAPRHHFIVRVTHWLTFPLIVLMASSGLQIYRAYPRFGERGGPYAPNLLQDSVIPEFARLGGWLAGGLHWHFMLMWPFMAVGLVYLIYIFASREWQKLVFRPSDVPEAIQMARYYLRLRKDNPALGKHNALQKGAYTFIVSLGMLSVLTGLAVWKPVQLSWLTFLFGGFQFARYWHFLAVWLFAGFTAVHVFMVLFTDPATLRAMVTGKYRSGHGGR